MVLSQVPVRIDDAAGITLVLSLRELPALEAGDAGAQIEQMRVRQPAATAGIERGVPVCGDHDARSGRRSRGHAGSACEVMLPLFDDPSSFDRRKLADQLRSLAARDIWIGTSSLEVRGLVRSQIYSRGPLTPLAAVSRRSGLRGRVPAEYAETFPTVCGDFPFYQFPEAVLAEAVHAPRRGSFRLQGAGGDHGEGFPDACPVRACRGNGGTAISSTRDSRGPLYRIPRGTIRTGWEG